MRKNTLYIVMAVFGLLGFHAGRASAASSNTNAMTVRFNFTALVQGSAAGVTNGTSTNVIYKLNKFRFADKDMLSLLATEFGTTFPDGAQLGLTVGFGFVVLDKAGNIFLNVSTNLSDTSYVFSITNNSSSVSTEKISEVPHKTTAAVSQVSPDFTIYYADGKGNQFHFGGLGTVRYTIVYEAAVSTLKTVSVTVSGSGGGTLFNPGDAKYETVVLTGPPWMATGANFPY